MMRTYYLQQVKRQPPRPAPRAIEAADGADALLRFAKEQRWDCQALRRDGGSAWTALLGTNQKGWLQYRASPGAPPGPARGAHGD